LTPWLFCLPACKQFHLKVPSGHVQYILPVLDVSSAGLIKLFNRNEDMIATVVGHECAHAVARHSSEKLSLGLFIALGVQVGTSWHVALTCFHSQLSQQFDKRSTASLVSCVVA
jgi:hypothetical protein